jgi:predicted RNase H-like HicB family nuclease
MGHSPILSAYLAAALAEARYEDIDEGVYAEIPSLPGVYAVAATRDESEAELREVLEEWLLLGLTMGHAIPPIGGAGLHIALVS